MAQITEPRPIHPTNVLLVALGGAGGAALRDVVGRALGGAPDPGHFPVATFVINLTGAAVLGFLLVLAAPLTGRRAHVRPLLATGVIGAYTTTSTFAVETARLVDGHDWRLAIAYALTSAVGGVALAGVGMTVGRELRSRWAAPVVAPAMAARAVEEIDFVEEEA